MKENVFDGIHTILIRQHSFEISFTPAWKGYEIRSSNAESELVENIEEWFHEEFIHTLIDLGMDSEEMIFKFGLVNNALILEGTFISYGHDYYRDYLYKLSDLIGEPIVSTLSAVLSIEKDEVDFDDIEMQFDYSSIDKGLKDFNLFYQDKQIIFTNQQMQVITSFLLDTLGNWNVGSGGEEQFRDLYTEVSVDHDYFRVKTHGNATFKITTDSICLI